MGGEYAPRDGTRVFGVAIDRAVRGVRDLLQTGNNDTERVKRRRRFPPDVVEVVCVIVVTKKVSLAKQ